MDPRKRTRRFAALVRKERKLNASPEVSHQSTSSARPEQIPPSGIPEESTPAIEKDEGTVGKTTKRMLFPADPERLQLSLTGSEETKLAVLEHETRSKELAEGKLFINWPDSMAWETLWIGYVWGVPFAIEESLMDFYEYMWYPPYTRGVGLGYGNPDAVAVYNIGTEPARYPAPQLGQHFVAESAQSKSLEAGSTDKLLTGLMDYEAAEKAFADIDTASDGLSQRRASVDGVVAESAPSPLLLTEAEVSGVRESIIAEAAETEVISIAEDTTNPAISTAHAELEISKCSEGVGTSMGKPTLEEGQSKAAFVSSDTIIATVVGAGEGTDPADEPRINISESQLERFMERYMMKRLNNNWSLEAYKKKIDDCVTRSFDNKEAITEVGQTLSEFKSMLVAMQKDIADLKEGATAQTSISENLRKDIDVTIAAQTLLTTQVNSLQESSDKSLAESISVQGSLHKLSAESSTQWSRHDVDHVGISARLSGLEELRRLDNVSRGQERIADFFSIKMDGFQECLEVLIAHGYFDRRILHNPKIMDLIKDVDALRAKLAEKEKAIPGRGGQSKG